MRIKAEIPDTHDKMASDVKEARTRKRIPAFCISGEEVAESAIEGILKRTESRQITYSEVLFYPEILEETKFCCAWVAPEWKVPVPGDYKIVRKKMGMARLKTFP